MFCNIKPVASIYRHWCLNISFILVVCLKISKYLDILLLGIRKRVFSKMFIYI